MRPRESRGMEQRFDAALFDLFGTLVDERGDAIPGAREILSLLPASRWAIVTSCSRRLAHGLIEHAGLPQPSVVVTSEDVERGKPAPDGYLLAAKELQAEPDRCLVIEDSRQGIAAGVAAGMTVVAVGREIAHLRDLALVPEPSGELRLGS